MDQHGAGDCVVVANTTTPWTPPWPARPPRRHAPLIALVTGGAFGEETWLKVSVDFRPQDFTPMPDFSPPDGTMTFGYLRSNWARFPSP